MVAWLRLIGNNSKLLRAFSRGKNERLGSPRSSLPNPTFMAISQQLATLTSFRLSASSISDLVLALNGRSSQKNYSMACVSSSRVVIPHTPGNLPAEHRNQAPSNALMISRCRPCTAIDSEKCAFKIARGSPFCTIISCSPGFKPEIISPKCALASSRFTVAMMHTFLKQGRK